MHTNEIKRLTSVDELDSHLYQSVGTHVVSYIAQALELPLYTHVIRGQALERGAEYGSRIRSGEGSGTHGDETEDLMELLQAVLVSSSSSEVCEEPWAPADVPVPRLYETLNETEA